MLALAILALPFLAPGMCCASQDPQDPPASNPDAALKIAPASKEAQEQIKSFKLAPGLVCDLVAAEPDLCNGVAFAIDGKGRFYVAETFRINAGVFDTRDYLQWKDDDLACLTVADRLAKYHKHIAADLPKYDAIPERIRMLVDTDRNGTLDRSTVFATGFTDLADGIASGVLPVGDDVYFTNIPKLWRLRDRDGDGIADERHVLHDGYGVHTSLIGHDLHGLIVGPDRRLWFSIGDRGLHVQQGATTLAYPHEGAVLRCELDGSDLEVVHRGLRNPQELAFDAWGELFTGDNNSDGGDRARFVQIVPGADSGWRIGYQWLSDRGAWNREKLWHPRHPGQPAWILPPITNFADGPSGLAYDPGVGLPERYRGCFFLCDFRGGSSYSGVHALRLQHNGAGFELASREHVIWGALCTDVDFGPDGTMYVLDWVASWSKTGKGRIYRVRTESMANDMALRNTATLLASDLKDRDETTLRALLGHADRRVRQQAQFALVDLDARTTLAAVAKDGASRFARLHGIWGLGVLGRRDPQALESVPALLDDGDADVRAMAARVLGDVRPTSAGKALTQTLTKALTKALTDGNSRVKKEAALALARFGAAADTGAGTAAALVTMLRHNDDRDHMLRHAAVFALGEVAAATDLLPHCNDDSIAVRRGILLAMARRRDAAIATFLTDSDPSLRQEAARAIYEEPIADAMPMLARLICDEHPDVEALDWRAINANRILGEVENGEVLVNLASLTNHPLAARVEALHVLAEWPQPHGQDRVTGNWRPSVHRNPQNVLYQVSSAARQWLDEDAIAAVAAKTLGALKLLETGDALLALAANPDRPTEARLAALNALDAMAAPQLQTVLSTIDGSAPPTLRHRAVALLSRTAPERAVPVLATLLENADTQERQAAFAALADLQHPTAATLVEQWLDRLAAGTVDAALQLDLLEAAQKHDVPAIRERLAARAAAEAQGGPLATFLVCREGGDAKEGRKVFFDNEATRCSRCHVLDGQGGNAGPALDGIGKRVTRDHLLESLVLPSARIAEGFGSTTVELHDGSSVVGFVTKDQDGALTVVDVNSDPHSVPWERIKARSANATSAMPPMGGALSPRQVRDLIAFLMKQQ